MKHKPACLLIISLVLVLSCVNPASAVDWIWAKGNLHTHTTNSDGEGSPQEVADWYKDNGYQFLVISDHDKVTDVAPLDKDPTDGYILISGEEVAVAGDGPPIHGNAIGISRTLPRLERADTQGESVRILVEYIRKAGGIPMVNHPNWKGSLSHRDLLMIDGPFLLEIANMGDAYNAGSYSRMSIEQMWDFLLSQGREVYATATDDMHRLKDGPKGKSQQGKGWVVTRVPELTQSAILMALSKGEFYASNGVDLFDYSFNGKEFKVQVAPKADITYLIRFVGKWGSILQETEGISATYTVVESPEQNSYMRCKVIASDDTVAWTQVYRINDQQVYPEPVDE